MVGDRTIDRSSSPDVTMLCVQCAVHLILLYGYTSSVTGQGEDCPSGHQWDPQPGRCHPCPVGTYRTKGQHVKCQKCPPGYATKYEGAHRESECRLPVESRNACPSGTEWQSFRERCVDCRRHTYRTQGIEYWCVPCPPGTALPRGILGKAKNDCVSNFCPAGTYWTTSNRTIVCRLCPPGFYGAGYDEDRCTPCPRGLTNPYPGASSSQNCTEDTMDDYYFNEGDCPACTVWNVTVSACVPVQNQTIGESPGDCRREIQFLNNSCPSGTQFRRMVNWCEVCPIGTYRNQIEAEICVKCPYGWTNLKRGGTSNFTCTVPAEGPYNLPRTQEGCEPGYTPVYNSTTCILCHRHSYKPYRGDAPCLSCPVDRWNRTQRTTYRGATRQKQCIPDPFVLSLEPDYGPVAGGTVVTLKWQEHNGRQLQTLLVGDQSCLRVRSGGMKDVYITPELMTGNISSENYPVRASFTHDILLTAPVHFKYMPNPVVLQVSRKKLFISGGINILFTGQHFSSVAQPKLIISNSATGRQLLTQSCTSLTSEQVKCRLPNLKLLNQRPRTRRSTDNSTDVHPYTFILKLDGILWRPGESNETRSSPDLTVYSDPELASFQDGMRSYHWRSRKDQLLNLTFYGKDLDLGAQETDYKIKGLGIPCTAIYLQRRHLVCTIDTASLGERAEYNVTVEVGNLVFAVGVVSLVREEEAEEAAAPPDQMRRLALIIGLALFSALLFMVFLVILLHYAVKRWRHRRKRADKNHLVNGGSHVTTSAVSTLTSVTRYKSENGIRTVALPENRLLQLPLEQSMKIELTLWCIRPEDVTFLRVLREGLTGRLSSAILRCTESKSRQVMVKSLKGSEMTVDCISVFLQDSTRLKDAQHPNVLPLCGVTIGLDSVPHAIFPYVLGNLHGFLTTEEGKGLIKSNIQSVCRQIASGMAFIASVGIVHSDLATRNIWVSRDHEIQVGDAALSRDFFSEDYWPVTPYSRPVPVRWMAPENFIHEKFTMKSDVWSFGVVLWEIHTCGSQPYKDVSNANVGPMVRDGKTLTRPPGCADILYSIMASCWRPQPLDRPDFEEILRQLQPPEASPTMATRL